MIRQSRAYRNATTKARTDLF